ncbi:MAG TPA: SDR family oxidoreductase [Candidatus Thermoplasmatota archaeon]|nr:SDR family oxidoreductase [Candidatus Thermoplasmatota archaeon]
MTKKPRNVLVTGGSSGIGRSTVERFARAGDRVWFTYRTGADRAKALVSELHGADVAAFAFDQGDKASHDALLAALPGDVDVLVNNAGLGTKTVEGYVAGAAEQDAALLHVNAVGPLWLAQALVPGMVERGYGKVVNVASVDGGVTQFPGFRIADGMSKAALAFMTRQLAAELAHDPVDVFAVCPGATETSMFEASTLKRLSVDERRAFEAALPRGRLIQPDEIADLVFWLCGDEARVLHGAVLDASLGLGVHPGLMTGRRKA